MEKMEPKRRRSSTTSRMIAMAAGQSTQVHRRHRGNSYQGVDSGNLVPDDFVASPSAQPAGAGGLFRFRKNEKCMDTRLCKLLLVLLGLGCCYIVFTLIFDEMHREDPCEVSRRSLALLAAPNDDRKGMPQEWKPEVPKIVHQQWKSDKVTNEKYLVWQERWKTLFPAPEYEYILWTDDTQRALIEEHYNWFLPYYDGYKFNIQRADAVRYFIMYHFGGVYADLDYEPLVNFWNHLPQDRVGLIESPYQYNEWVQNSMMSSPRHDPFWTHALKILVAQHDQPVLSATGPVFLDTAIKTNPEPWYPLPCENFHRIPLGEQDQSPFLTLLHREVLGRIYPMKQCGDYSDFTCQLGRHHNTASYLKDTGLFDLIWT